MDLATPYDRLRDLVDRLTGIGDRPGDDADLLVRKHALAATMLGLIPASLVWLVIGLAIGSPLLAASSVYFSAAMLVGLVALAQIRDFTRVVRALLVAGMVYVFLGHVALGGLVAGGAPLIWGILAPVSAVLYFDASKSLKWFGAYAAMVLASIVFDGFIVSLVPPAWEQPPLLLMAYNLLGPALIILLLIRYVDGQRLKAQQQASDLLHDMLPRAIAERLARGERLIVDAHPSATVVFADVVNFTGLAASIAPRELLLILNQLFSMFDRLAERHGLEKIKTMGDAYIAVAGAPVAREDHARAAIEMAVEMHRAVARLGGLRRRAIQLRVGVASGPLTAGVLGENKWAYDIWGDTVNVAARMEGYGVPGRVQLAPSTRELVGDAFPLTMRTVDVKGKGLMATYLLDPADAPKFYRAPDGVAGPTLEPDPVPAAEAASGSTAYASA
ncbi:MAG TPA: adenylate/guanylate cyclase domain-containing protein [Candidatus Limnocylindria bacterium]|nr:adenylate/guanylate cyclase domain-containing protein [Candidatus Limnocylindria bacterium]